MPSGKNWLAFIFINIAFFTYIFVIFYYSQLEKIKADWPLYRCNPMYMWVADNVEENFTYCIQNMQTNYMGFLLQPLTYITDSLSSMSFGFMIDIQNVRAMFYKIRTFFATIFTSIFSVFINLIIEFQKITIGIKDLVGKLIGIIVTLLYTLDGSIKTMNSTWNGPPGQLVRSLGKCFYPTTNVRLQDGTIKMIKEIEIGDILEDNNYVTATMKIDNVFEPECLFKIKNNGVNGENIYVTGSHLVLDKSVNKFIKVKDYEKAEISTLNTNYFICLITSKHFIKIGNEIFWDWEDHFIKMRLRH